MLTHELPTDFDRAFSLAYEELKRIAAAVRRRHPGAALNTTGLVHEAWLKLQSSSGLHYESPAHLKAIAARAMRQILLDIARRNAALKRGPGEDALLIAWDGPADPQAAVAVDVLDLETALCKLAAMSHRQAEVVQCRFYGSMTVTETAESMGLSEASVERDWRAAKAWLAAMLHAPKRS